MGDVGKRRAALCFRKPRKGLYSRRAKVGSNVTECSCFTWTIATRSSAPLRNAPLSSVWAGRRWAGRVAQDGMCHRKGSAIFRALVRGEGRGRGVRGASR